MRSLRNQRLMLIIGMAACVLLASATVSHLPLLGAGVCLVVLTAISLPLPKWL